MLYREANKKLQKLVPFVKILGNHAGILINLHPKGANHGTSADDILEYFFHFIFSEKVRLDISWESSARQRIHMKHPALFFL